MTTNERIVRKSLELFTRFGINSVRTDDISMELGISKKTFYKHFVSKEELVVCVTERLLSDTLTEIDKPVKTCCNSIVQASEIWDRLIAFRKKNNPNFLMDLKRYYARAWNLVETFRTEYLTPRSYSKFGTRRSSKFVQSRHERKSNGLALAGSVSAEILGK